MIVPAPNEVPYRGSEFRVFLRDALNGQLDWSVSPVGAARQTSAPQGLDDIGLSFVRGVPQMRTNSGRVFPPIMFRFVTFSENRIV